MDIKKFKQQLALTFANKIMSHVKAQLKTLGASHFQITGITNNKQDKDCYEMNLPEWRIKFLYQGCICIVDDFGNLTVGVGKKWEEIDSKVNLENIRVKNLNAAVKKFHKEFKSWNGRQYKPKTKC